MRIKNIPQRQLYKRRDFLQGITTTLSLFLISKFSFISLSNAHTKSYTLTFCCKKLNQNSPTSIEEDRNKFEHTKKISEINDFFIRSGHILSFNMEKDYSSIKWIYTFKNKESFLLWDRVIVENDCFSRARLPNGYLLDVLET